MSLTLPRFAHPASTLQCQSVSLRAGALAHGRLLCEALSVRFEPGQRWALLGPNGAGKSTLLSALAGLSAPQGGDITLGGRPLRQWPLAQLATQRAWCPQFWLDPFAVSAWETVACAIVATQPELDRQAVAALARQWLSEFDAAHLADHDVRTLSGGERQRVALATACAQSAPILLLDEPTAHLDWAHQRGLRALALRWSEQGGTLLAAVHDLNLAWSFASHVLLLDGHGQVQAGSREALMDEQHLSAAFNVPVRRVRDGQTQCFLIELE